MLIGQFCETYPPTLDGVGRVMLSYCQTLEKLGHHSVYVAPRNANFQERVSCPTLLYRSVGIPGQNYRVGLPRADKHYRCRIAKLPFDIVHVHSPFVVGHEARMLARRYHIPLVATFHSKYYDDFYRATSSRLIARACVRSIVRFYKSCDEVWAVNRLTADVLRGYGYRGKIVIMPNGTNPQTVTDETRSRAREAYPLREGVPTLMFAGQQDFKKNIGSILEACALLQKQGMDFQMIMVGEGPNLKQIKQRVRELGMAERFVFTGFLSDRPLLLALYERADLFVFPSLYDNAPMVVREAASMSTPALLVRGSCSSEGIVDGENGYLCSNTVADIARGVREALPTASEVGRRAKETIPIPWGQLMEQVVARYQALIEKKQSEHVPLFRKERDALREMIRSKE